MAEAVHCLDRALDRHAGRRGSGSSVLHSGDGSSTRPRRTLKHDDCFAVLDSHGDIGASPGGPDGIFIATPAISRISNCCSTACSRCCWARMCATTIPSSPSI